MYDFSWLLDLYIPEQFGSNEYNEETGGIDEMFAQLPGEVITRWGATQFVIMTKDSDKVAKIPFNGEEFEVEEPYYDEDGNEQFEYNTGFDYFRTNYCNLSYELYCDAEERGIEQILAKIEYFGNSTNGVGIYLQEAVMPFDYVEGNSNYFKTEEERTRSRERLAEANKKYTNREYSLGWYMFPTDWAAAALDYYGEEFMTEFLHFCRDNGLNDFHDGNVGWRKDGSPVICDWAGFNE